MITGLMVVTFGLKFLTAIIVFLISLQIAASGKSGHQLLKEKAKKLSKSKFIKSQK